MIYNDGLVVGITQCVMDIARNCFLDGISYEIVRDSITRISEND